MCAAVVLCDIFLNARGGGVREEPGQDVRRDSLAFAERPQWAVTLLYAAARRHRPESGRGRSARLGECRGIVAAAILRSVEQIANGTTCIFPSGCPKSQRAEGHLWEAAQRSHSPIGRFGLVRLAPLHLRRQHQCLNVTYVEI